MNNIPSFLLRAFLPLILLFSGCITSNRLATRLLTAPNQNDRSPSAGMASAWSRALKTRDPFVYHNVPISSPPAQLAVAELPPGKYDVDFSSNYETTPDGKKILSFNFHYKNAGKVQPVEKERGTIVLLHGYMMSREIMYPWAFSFARLGFRVLAPDLRGHGQSTGQTISFGKYETADLVQLLDHFQQNAAVEPPVSILGVSMGASLALHWAARDSRINTVVAIAPYNQPEEAFLRFVREMKIPVSERTATKALAIAAQRLGLTWSNWSAESALRSLSIPVFIVGGARDRIVPKAELEFLHGIAPPGSKLFILPDGNHDSIALSLTSIGPPIITWLLKPPSPSAAAAQ